MTYFDKTQLLSQNPTEPSSIDREISNTLQYFTNLKDIKSRLDKYKSTLLQENSRFEAVLDAYWYYGYGYFSRTFACDKLLEHLLYKQIITFLKTYQPDIEKFLQAFQNFYKDNYRDLVYLYDFTFEKKQVVCKNVSINIINERIDTLFEKKQWLDEQTLFKKIDKQDYNDSQNNFSKYIECCTFVLLQISANKGFEAIQIPYQNNQINIVEAVLEFCKSNHAENHEEKFGILEKIRFINQQRINQSKNIKTTVDYYKPDNLEYLATSSNNPNTKYLITLIGIDILTDMAGRTKTIADSLVNSPYKNTFSLIQCKLNRNQHPQAYQQLSHTLQRLAQDKELSLSCRLRAMLVAFDYLDIYVDNHRELIKDMIHIPSRQWGMASGGGSRIWFSRKIFTLADVLASIDKKHLSYEALDFLEKMQEVHTQDSKIMEQIFSAIFAIFNKQLDYVSQKHKLTDHSLMGQLNNLLLNYPLSVDKQWQVINQIKIIRQKVIAKKLIYFGAITLSTYLVLWQEKINQSSTEHISFIDETDPYITPWDKASLYWKNNAINKAQAFKALQACELIKKTDTEKKDCLYEQLKDLMNESNNLEAITIRRLFQENKGGYEGYFDLMSEILSLLDIEINYIENPKTFISLNYCHKHTYMYKYIESNYFEYNNQCYEFITYYASGELLFSVALLNVFLEKISHDHRFYEISIKNVEYEGITTAKYIDFEETNKQLKLPIKQVTWEAYGFIPVDLSLAHQQINPDYQHIIEQGYVYLSQNKIIVPKQQSMASFDAEDWLIVQLPHLLIHIQNQINTAFTKTLNTDDEYANIKQIFDISVHWRNMLVAISRRALFDEYFCDYKYRKYPLWDDAKSKQVFNIFMEKIQKKRIFSKKNTTNKTKLYIAIRQYVLDEKDIREQVS